MTEETKKPALWTYLVDPKRPFASRVFYKGEPVGMVQQMSVGVELVDGSEGKPVPQTILSLRILVQDLALGTFDSEALEKEKEKAPAQEELPLFEKKP